MLNITRNQKGAFVENLQSKNKYNVIVNIDTRKGYTLMPNTLLYDRKISDGAKLLFCAFQNIGNFKDIKSNDIMKIAKISEKTYKKYIKELKNNDYLNVIRENHNRYIYILNGDKDFNLITTNIDINNLDIYRTRDLEKYLKSGHATEKEKRAIKEYFDYMIKIITTTKWLDN